MTATPLTNASSLKALDFDAVRALLVGRATRDANRAAFGSLEPGPESREAIEALLDRVAVLREMIDEGGLRFEGIPEVGDLLETLAVRGSVLDGPELALLARFAESSSALGREVEVRLSRAGRGGERMADEARDLGRSGELGFVAKVGRAIGPKGEVRDDASPELRRLRARSLRLREDLDLVFESYLRRPNAEDVLQDKVVASRNGRSVLMVKAEAKRSFDGVVHGASRAQKTAFIEPIEAVEVNNELVVVSEEEQEEIRQILRRLSDEARLDLEALRRADRVLEACDELHARARLGRDLNARTPVFSSEGTLRIVRGVHPLLTARARADLDLSPAAREPVPLDLELDPEHRILVIGGPNTGGKTVALKTVGLLSLMARCGLPIPADEGTTLPFFASVFAEIGDDQSLGSGLSTFSAQIAGIARMTLATGASLVLLDELGSGTDPLEGGALGASIIEDFARRGAIVLATTHNADIKLFAQESPGARCASFAYDPASFAPTYRLVPNQPGRSLAFEIASRLGVPAPVVEAARARLPEAARRQEMILADLAREKAALAVDRQALERDKAATSELQRTLDARLARIDEERERMREDTRQRILKRREEEDRRLRSLFAEAEERLKAAKTPRAVAKVRAETLSGIVPAEEARVAAAAASAALGVGDFVVAPALGWRGRITAVSAGDVEIEASGKRIRLGRDLVQLARDAKTQDRPRPGAPFPSPSPAPSSDSRRHAEAASPKELMLIGLRVDEASALVDKFLDDAFLADAAEVRLVHGFGQGRLRSAVRDILKNHPHVTSFRDGAPNEGGAGATVAELRR